MAVIGTAKNARVKFRAESGYESSFTLNARGGSYQFNADTYFRKGLIKRGSTDLATNNIEVNLTSVYTAEIIDSSLKLYKDDVLISQAVDSTYLISGAWDLLVGHLVSFENLDNVVPTGTNMQIQVGGAWKPVESVQVQVDGTWKPVVAGSQILVGGVWKTIF